MLSASQFTYSPSAAAIRYVKITTLPATADGSLILTVALAKNDTYGYPAIAAGKTLTAGAILPAGYLQYLKLTTKSTSTAESVSFSFTVTADLDVKTALWPSPAAFTVDFLTMGNVTLTTDTNTAVSLNASDMASKFLSGTGYSLSYITFTLPASSSGTLVTAYSAVTNSGTVITASTKYYPDGSPLPLRNHLYPRQGFFRRGFY